MSNKPWQISRRTMLRGVGASMALPLLDAMMPAARLVGATSSAAGAAAKPPIRAAFLFMPNGVWAPDWTPTQAGRDFELTKSLSPLAKLKDELLVLTELRNKNSLTGEGHYVKTTALLTGGHVRRTGGRDLHNGISVDQMAAKYLGDGTPLPSMQLGIDPVWNKVDMGYSTVYGAHISWKTPTLPVTNEINPQQAFDRMFRWSKLGAGGSDKSVLDIVLDDARSLRNHVGANDRKKLDEYLQSVRDLEKRITAAAKMEDRNWDSVLPEMQFKRPQDRPPADFDTHVKLMLDIMVMAFRTNTTNICTFMFGNAVSGRNFSFLDGVSGGHHDYSHHQNKEEKWRPYQLINQHHVKLYAYMLERMANIKEGESTLLDNSMVMFGSGLRDGNRHDPNNLPIVVAGRAGGRLDTGRHVKFAKHTPLCNLYVTMLQAMGLDIEQFGDSTGPLSELHAKA